MENKKMKTVINAEEEYLVSMSTKTSRKVVKKATKTKEASVNMEIKEELNNTDLSNVKTGAMPDGVSKELELDVSQSMEVTEGSNLTIRKKNKSKKSKKCEYDNQNISVKSSFNKFDALQKRNLIHVRSSDSSKAQEIFSNPQDEQQINCRQCNKPVYKMEEVIVQFKSDKIIYHKSCLRCKDCAKQLKLFAPKVVEQSEEPKLRKMELIIRESQPTELPPGVVRASDKPDLGLDELHQLNVRLRFQVFENVEQKKLEEPQLQRPVINRSTSVLSKYRIHTSSDGGDGSGKDEGDNGDGEENEDADLVRCKRCTQKERPVGIGHAMNDIKTRFENGNVQSKEERREERKQEIQNIRSRLFMGKQAKIKEMYQQAVAESEQSITSVGKKPEVELGGAARSIKERFENGEIFCDKVTNDPQSSNKNSNCSGISEDAYIFESAISKTSRSIFMELDANLASNTNEHQELQKNRSVALTKCLSQNQVGQENANVVKYDAKPEDVKITTAEISQKFKFFETFRANNGKEEKRQFRITPPREGVVKMPTPDSDSEQLESELRKKLSFHDNVLQKTQTTSTMLNKFREMEQNTYKRNEKKGPRALKCFTPPPEDGRYYNDKSNSEEDEDEESDDESDVGRDILALNLNNEDEALKEAQSAARAKQLCAKFEKWQANEIKREINEGYVDIYSQQVSDDSTIESAKTIRDRFENMTNVERKLPTGPRYQVNRFV